MTNNNKFFIFTDPSLRSWFYGVFKKRLYSKRYFFLENLRGLAKFEKLQKPLLLFFRQMIDKTFSLKGI